MPKGPRGDKRPGDLIGAAIMVAKIASGEVEDNATPADKAHHLTRIHAHGRLSQSRERRPIFDIVWI